MSDSSALVAASALLGSGAPSAKGGDSALAKGWADTAWSRAANDVGPSNMARERGVNSPGKPLPVPETAKTRTSALDGKEEGKNTLTDLGLAGAATVLTLDQSSPRRLASMEKSLAPAVVTKETARA